MFFAGSAALTRHVVRVEGAFSPPLVLRIDGVDPQDAPQVQIAHWGHKPGLGVVFHEVGPGTRRLTFGPIAQRSQDQVQCFDGGSSGPTLGRLVQVNFNEMSYGVTVAGIARKTYYRVEFPVARAAAIDVSCGLVDSVVHDTFTSRSFTLTVLNRAGFHRDEQILPARSIAFFDEDAKELRVTDLNTGEERLASSIVSSGDYHTAVKFTWESVADTAWRDIYFVIIGTLVALGAATAIEGVRPYVELLTRARAPLPGAAVEKPAPPPVIDPPTAAAAALAAPDRPPP